jgi:hypothetical protein
MNRIEKKRRIKKLIKNGELREIEKNQFIRFEYY